jgi:hypothetical protein
MRGANVLFMALAVHRGNTRPNRKHRFLAGTEGVCVGSIRVEVALAVKGVATVLVYIRALSVGILWVTSFVCAAAPVPTSAVVSVADGAPFLYTRGTVMYSATKGAYLSPGDLIESKPDSLLILEFRSGTAVCAVVAIGPSTRAYWMDRRDGATLAMISGWVKVDTLSSVPSAAFKVQGTHLGAASNGGTYILHAAEGVDEVFHEGGTMTLWVQKPDGTGIGRSSKPNEFASRTGTSDVQSQPRTGAAFNAALPSAFRDPLPSGLAAQLRAKNDPKFIRDVSYEDVSAWLAAPRDWRKDFTVRFRPRLKDSTFFHDLDAHMGAHPEWNHILHPPPPPDDVAPVRPAVAAH